MESIKKYEKATSYVAFTIRDCMISLAALGVASFVCIVLQTVTENDTHVPLIFVLAVFVTALLTNGYVYGIIISIFSVFFVNWAFTYPYGSLDFSIYGYPITFVTMLTVSIVTSTLISGYKQRGEALRYNEAEKVRANFLRSISHDLRTPLAIIIGDSEMLMANENKEENKALIADINENANWLVRMVENILSITRINGSAGTIKKSDEIPEEIIGSIIEKFKRMHSDVEFVTSFPDTANFVKMDSVLVTQLFFNLFENAVQHGKCNKISITMTEEKHFVEFRVCDNGMGINSDLLDHLFDVGSYLQQNAISDTNKYMGIGLMVCKTIAEAHGGTIKALNTSDGAEFIFSFSKIEKEENHAA